MKSKPAKHSSDKLISVLTATTLAMGLVPASGVAWADEVEGTGDTSGIENVIDDSDEKADTPVSDDSDEEASQETSTEDESITNRPLEVPSQIDEQNPTVSTEGTDAADSEEADVEKTDMVAEVNGTAYGTLKAAVDAAGDGDTVILLRNAEIIESQGDWNIAKSITLDLAGYTISMKAHNRIVFDEGNDSVVKNGVIRAESEYAIETGGKLTLEDVSVSASNVAVVNQKMGELLVNGCNLYGGGYAIKNNGGKFEINGGAFSGGSAAIYVHLYTMGANVNGGRFIEGKAFEIQEKNGKKALIPKVTGGTFADDLCKIVPEGYVVVKEGDVFAVHSVESGYDASLNNHDACGHVPVAQTNSTKFGTLKAAGAGAKKNETLTLLQNTVLDEEITIGCKGFAFDLGGHELTITGNGRIKTAGSAAYTYPVTNGVINADTDHSPFWTMNDWLRFENVEVTSEHASVVDVRRGGVIVSEGAILIAKSGNAITFVYDHGTATITGGTLVGDDGIIGIKDADANVNVKVSGGVFSHDVSDYVIDGYEVVENEDGTFTVRAAEGEEPVVPVDPEEPVDPVDPTPITPNEPDNPAEDVTPVLPDEPDLPEGEDEPEVPSVPDEGGETPEGGIPSNGGTTIPVLPGPTAPGIDGGASFPTIPGFVTAPAVTTPVAPLTTGVGAATPEAVTTIEDDAAPMTRFAESDDAAEATTIDEDAVPMAGFGLTDEVASTEAGFNWSVMAFVGAAFAAVAAFWFFLIGKRRKKQDRGNHAVR